MRSYVYTGRIIQLSGPAEQEFGVDIDIDCNGLCPTPGDRVTGAWTYDAGVDVDIVVTPEIVVYAQSISDGMVVTVGGVSFSNSRFGIVVVNDDIPSGSGDGFNSDSGFSPINGDILRAGFPFNGDMNIGSNDPTATFLDSTSLLDLDPVAFNDVDLGSLQTGVRWALQTNANAMALIVSAGKLEPGRAILSWQGARGRVTTINNQITFSGEESSGNSVNSSSLSTLGFSDNYELRFAIDTDPAGTTWAVGLGTTETGPSWVDIEHALRSSEGTLEIRESGQWRTRGPELARGDIIAVRVNNGLIEYRHNDTLVYASTYTGAPDFYVDTAFRRGMVSLSAMVVGEVPPPAPLVEPLVDWYGARGGVTTSGNLITYSGTPTGWRNTVISPALHTLGFADDFEVQFTIEGDPSDTTWVVGLGTNETGSGWTDVENGLRSADGMLSVRENGTWRKSGGLLATGDVLAIKVSNGVIEYRHNGVTIYASSYNGSPDFYVDTSFQSGAIALSVSVAR